MAKTYSFEKGEEYTPLQQKVLNVLREPNNVCLSAKEIAQKIGVAPGSVGGVLASLRLRRVICKTRAHGLPFRLVTAYFVTRTDGVMVGLSTHWFMPEKKEYIYAFKRLRQNCARLAVRRYYSS